jgi:alpha-beta hydrolase superfamily lysophospholipase
MKVVEKTLRTLDDFDLFYRRYDPKGKAKCAVIALHGMSLHSGHYIQWAKELAEKGIVVIAPDLRGRGRSVSAEWKKGEIHSVKRLSQDILELRNKEISDLPVYIMGASMGGVIGLYHAMYTDHIAGVAAGGPPFGVYSPAALLMTSLIATIAPDHIMQGSHSHLQNIAGSVGRLDLLQKDPLVIADGMNAVSTLEILRTIRQMQKVVPHINVPILIVYGNRDKLITRRQMEIMKEKLASKHCEIRVIDGMGHDLLGEDQHDACLDVMLEWLGKQQPNLLTS